MKTLYHYLIGVVLGLLSLAVTTTTFAAKVNPHQAFIARLARNSAIANKRILHKRELLLRYHQDYYKGGQPLSQYASNWVRTLARQYQVNGFNLANPESWQTLIARVDIIPASLVIAQAANESAWGTSRFAKLGNAYFGQACYVRGCGIVPKSRPAGKTFEVQKFPSMLAAVESYMLNLNSNPSYAQLRRIRRQLRQQHQPISGFALAVGLVNYAIIGERYVTAIQSLINRRQLAQYDG